MELNQVDITLFNSGNLRYFICTYFLYDRCLGRTSSKEIKFWHLIFFLLGLLADTVVQA